MAQSLCKIYLRIIFHIKSCSPAILDEHLNRLHEYVGKVVNTTGAQVLCVGGTGNHIHALVMLPSTLTASRLVEEMKRNSSRWIKTLSPAYSKFAWQNGYGAFSVSPSLLDKTILYIKNQERHHRTKSFQDEYKAFLEAYQIPYDEKYIFND